MNASTGETSIQLLHKIENAVIENTTVSSDKGKCTNWNAVARTVLQSCPKQSADVPAMISWFQKYGGGTSRQHIKFISMMFDKKVDPTRMVSGTFFKALADLKWPADHPIPTHFCNAILVVHAAAKENVVDNYARFIPINVLDKINVGGKKHSKAMAANDTIKKAIQLAKDAGLAEHETIIPKFNLMDRLVRLVFKHDPNKDSPEVDSNFITELACGAQYAIDVVNISPQANLETPWLQNAAVAIVSTKDASSSSSIVDYDADGQAVANYVRLRFFPRAWITPSVR